MANTIISAYAEATGRKSDAKSTGFNDGTRPPSADALAAMGLAMTGNNGNYTH